MIVSMCFRAKWSGFKFDLTSCMTLSKLLYFLYTSVSLSVNWGYTVLTPFGGCEYQMT